MLRGSFQENTGTNNITLCHTKLVHKTLQQKASNVIRKVTGPISKKTIGPILYPCVTPQLQFTICSRLAGQLWWIKFTNLKCNTVQWQCSLLNYWQYWNRNSQEKAVYNSNCRTWS